MQAKYKNNYPNIIINVLNLHKLKRMYFIFGYYIVTIFIWIGFMKFFSWKEYAYFRLASQKIREIKNIDIKICYLR